MAISNEKMRKYPFLAGMYSDHWFPNFLVDKGKAILIDLCEQIEKTKPSDLEQLYTLMDVATEKFNDLEDEFDENESEIETVAREVIGENFHEIALAYGFDGADREDVIRSRNW